MVSIESLLKHCNWRPKQIDSWLQTGVIHWITACFARKWILL